MFSLREYFENYYRLNNGAFDDVKVSKAIAAVTNALSTWGKSLRVKDVVRKLYP
jgi:hypothetical protein